MTILTPQRDTPLSTEALSAHAEARARIEKPDGKSYLGSLSAQKKKIELSLKTISESAAREELLVPASQWLIENARVIEERALRACQEGKRLGLLPSVSRTPRVLLVAKEIIEHQDASVTADNLKAYLEAYQGVESLTMRELNAIPAALRAVLVCLISSMAEDCAKTQLTRREADMWATRITENTPEASNSKKLIAALSDPIFVERLSFRLSQEESPEALHWLDDRLTDAGLSTSLVDLAHSKQALDRLWMGNAIISLYTIDTFIWSELFEELSPVESLLRDDPTGVYPRMDQQSRSYYRARIEEFSKKFGRNELSIARHALWCAQDGVDSLTRHVGYYLADDGEARLRESLGAPPDLMPSAIKNRRVRYYIGAVITATLIIYAALALCRPASPFMWILMSIVSAGIAVPIINSAITRALKPDFMPKLEYRELPDDMRTLVVVPTLITSKKSALEQIEKLHVLSLSQRDKNLHYAILGDFKDGPNETEPGDEDITQSAVSAIEKLNAESDSVFYYFHRKRVWSEAMGRWMGRERKRGALMALMGMLSGKGDEEFFINTADKDEIRKKFRYVITLDADTVLPPSEAMRMIGAMSHPLNEYRESAGRKRGYAVLSPRMGTLSGWSSAFAEIYGGEGGVDTYATSVSDVYQDAFGEGIFSGKGIFDPAVFENLDELVPDNAVLSHDLLEGCLTRAGLAGDITLYDAMPPTYRAYAMRLHRWTRGDWQLLPWIFGGRRRSLSLLSRYKMFDNLRRSLTTPFSFFLFILALLYGQPVFGVAAVIAMSPSLLLDLPALASRREAYAKQCAQAIIRYVVWPYESFLLLDAIFRSLYRVLFSHKHMLDWTTAADAGKPKSETGTNPYIRDMRLTLTFCGLFLGVWGVFFASGGWAWLDMPRLLASADPRFALALVVAVPWMRFMLAVMAVLPFGLAPFFMRQLDKPLEKDIVINDDDREFLWDVARRTWRFFEENVTRQDNYLPPDNVQWDPERGPAHRTSPTNIGLYLLSALAAHKLGLLGFSAMLERFERTLGSVDALDKWHGHLYNWYDTKDLSLLRPRYVSSVDSGNLAACLMTAAKGLEALDDSPGSRAKALAERMEKLVLEMDYSALYHEKRDLFAIGYDCENDELSQGCYDLLASESRLLSYIAIMKGDVPAKHWWRLGRPMTRAGESAALVSWSGTLFEYLMPNIFLRTYPETLLHETCAAAIDEQRASRNRQGLLSTAYAAEVWGVSESGYYAFDLQLNYQYRAFGTPALALKSENDERVISPYAAALSLPTRPSQAAENLRNMAGMGWLSDMGFYEAADYSSERVSGAAYKLVKSHMSHHQGMALCAICNTLSGGYIQDVFHSRPDVRAGEVLLMERIPPIPTLARRGNKSHSHSAKVEARAARQIRSGSWPPYAHLLSGGGTTLVLSDNGGGYAATGQLFWNRFRADPALDRYGFAFYMLDRDNGKVTPLLPPKGSKLLLEPGMAVWSFEADGVEAKLSVYISPETGAIVHEWTLHSRVARRVSIVSYFEIALCTHQADTAHPAFQNLFIETSANRNGIIARRRPREQGGKVLELAHGSYPAPVSYETDRFHFLGRCAGAYRGVVPRSLVSRDEDTGDADNTFNMENADISLRNHTGPVLEPCIALMVNADIPENGGETVYFTTAQPENDAEELLSRFDANSAVRARQMALTHAQVELQFLRMKPEEFSLYQRILPRIIYRGLPRIERYPLACEDNVLGQSALWSLGVSGDNPILCAVIDKKEQMELVREALHAHEFYRVKGIITDLLLINDYGNDYDQPVRDALREAVSASHARDIVSHPGGVHFVEGTLITGQQRALIMSVAAAVFFGGRGRMAAQLAPRPEAADMSGAREVTSPPPDNSDYSKYAGHNGQSEHGELAYYNGLGGFDENDDYVLTLKNGENTPAPWVNVVANPSFGFIISERGGGYTFAGNSRENKLTPWFNDAVSDPCGEAIYIRDDANYTVWSPTPGPARDTSPYTIRHSPGYSTFTHSSMALRSELTVFADAEEPVKVYMLKLSAGAEAGERELSVYFHADWVLGPDRSGKCRVGAEPEFLWAKNPFGDGRTGYVCSIPGMSSHSLDRRAFYGEGFRTREGGWLPSGLCLPALRGSTITCDPCATVQTRITLSPGETKTIIFMLGQEDDIDAVRNRVSAWDENRAIESLANVKSVWETRLSKLTVDTPDAAINLMVNRWLPYQAVSSRIFGRTGFYQAGGAYGFRDQLQDMLVMLSIDTETVRAHLLRCAAHQFEDGDVQHWWHPPARGVRTRMSDDLLFLPYITAAYVSRSGDVSVLSENVPYLKNVDIPDGHEDWYGFAQVSELEESLYSHCIRAIDRVDFGSHGLPLIGTGDWNDAMNRVGHDGKGESVWLGMFFIAVIAAFMPYCSPEDRDRLSGKREKLISAVEEHGWDGKWYRRAYFDDGTPLGSHESDECQIDAISQSWSVLAGLDPDRQKQAMNELYNRLVDKDECFVRLLYPAFKDGSAEPGYIKGYIAGVRENGGQYTHAAAWAALAFAVMGDGERAYEILSMLLPVNHSASFGDALRYRVEPYVVAADVYTEPPHVGQGGWTWYTGSASWLVVACVEGLLGFERVGNQVRLRPRVPDSWDSFGISVKCGESTWRLRVRCDFAGKKVGEWVEIFDDGKEHEITFGT